MNTPQDRFIKVGNINTRYWTEGNQGLAVLLIHGLGHFLEAWLPTFNALAANYRVYALDLLGHGRTDKPLNVSYKIADLAQFVANFMEALDIEQAHIVGHSLGGAIGTRLTLIQPEFVDKLVLVNSGGLGKEVTILFRIVSIPLLGEMLSRPTRSGATNLAKMSVYDPTVVTEEIIEQGYQMALPPDTQKSFLRVLRANINLFGQNRSIYSANVQGLSSIAKSVLVVWGRQDQIVPVTHVEVATKSLPNIRVHIFDDCGHLPMLEHTQSFNELLIEFLDS